MYRPKLGDPSVLGFYTEILKSIVLYNIAVFGEEVVGHGFPRARGHFMDVGDLLEW